MIAYTLNSYLLQINQKIATNYNQDACTSAIFVARKQESFTESVWNNHNEWKIEETF